MSTCPMETPLMRRIRLLAAACVFGLCFLAARTEATVAPATDQSPAVSMVGEPPPIAPQAPDQWQRDILAVAAIPGIRQRLADLAVDPAVSIASRVEAFKLVLAIDMVAPIPPPTLKS